MTDRGRASHHPSPAAATPRAVAVSFAPRRVGHEARNVQALACTGWSSGQARLERQRSGHLGELRDDTVGARPRHGSFAGRPSAALGRCTGDRPSSRRDAACRRHEELMAHSIPGSRSPPERFDGAKERAPSMATSMARGGMGWRFGCGLRSITGTVVGEEPSGSDPCLRSLRDCVGPRGPGKLGAKDGGYVTLPEKRRLARVSMRPEPGRRPTPSRPRVLGPASARSRPGAWRHHLERSARGPGGDIAAATMVVPRWPDRPDCGCDGDWHFGAGRRAPLSPWCGEASASPYRGAPASAGERSGGETSCRSSGASGWPRRRRRRRSS